MTFHTWHTQHYGNRWETLEASLLQERSPVPFHDGLLRPYYLDEASLSAAGLLKAAPGEKILDLCAAPGGKTLVIASALSGRGSLTANDRSSTRRARLRRVLDEHLPPALREIVRITSHDASRWGLYEQDAYDAVILDAPCSSERHVLSHPAEFAKWNTSRSRRLAVQQYAMLAAALDAAKPGGRILYCTCTVSPLENDHVLEKLLSRRGEECAIEPCESMPWGEPTLHGWIVLPDVSAGRGPMYTACIRKVKP